MQIIVYAGAIVILFLFVIMFLGVDRNEQLRVEPLAGQRPMAVVAVAVVTGGLIALMAAGGWYSGAKSVVAPTDPSNDVGVLGKTIFTTYLFAFEATSLLLIIAVVGAVLLARRRPRAGRGGRADAHGGTRRGGHARRRRSRRDDPRLVVPRRLGAALRDRRARRARPRNVLVIFMCIELMLNAGEPGARHVLEGPPRRRWPGDRVLRPRRRRRRGHRRARDRRRDLPAAATAPIVDDVAEMQG